MRCPICESSESVRLTERLGRPVIQNALFPSREEKAAPGRRTPKRPHLAPGTRRLARALLVTPLGEMWVKLSPAGEGGSPRLTWARGGCTV